MKSEVQVGLDVFGDGQDMVIPSCVYVYFIAISIIRLVLLTSTA